MASHSNRFNPRLHAPLMFLLMMVVLLMLPAIGAFGQCATLTETVQIPAPSSAPGDFQQYGWDVALDGEVAIIGAVEQWRDWDTPLNPGGSAYIYRHDAATGFWNHEASLKALDNENGDQFGYSLAISEAGGVAVVGSPFDDDNGTDSGSAYVFRFNGTTWVQEAKLTASDGAAFDEFGFSLAINSDGNTIIIGAHLNDPDMITDSGSAYMFRFDGTNWIQDATKITAPEGVAGAGDQFGESVSLTTSGSLILALVGAPGNNPGVADSGAAYVMIVNTPGSPLHLYKLFDGQGDDGDRFGSSVSISGRTALIGAPDHDSAGNNAGAAYVFSGVLLDLWLEDEKLTATPNQSIGSRFGEAVSLDGNIALVSQVTSERAYVFNYDSATQSWPLGLEFRANVTTSISTFARSLAISGENAIVGEWGSDPTGNLNGLAYLYDSFIDCDQNGVDDRCEPDLPDCNGNGISDACDIALGTSEDCNLNGIPDACEVVKNVDIVFIFDTSASMVGPIGPATLCGKMNDVVNQLSANGLIVNASFLGIFDTLTFDCLTDTVVSLFGTAVPSPPSCCQFITTPEDWGPATSVVADRYPWIVPSRIIVPLSDEAPWAGDPCDDPGNDRDTITNAIEIANLNGVKVLPVSAGGSIPCVQTLMQNLAAGTQGQWFDENSLTLVTDMVSAITNLATVLEADCNNNGIPDGCEPACLADITPQPCGNGIVNIDDLVAVLNGFGDCPIPPTACPADITPPGGNGTVNIDDLVLVLNGFGTCPPPGSGGGPGVMLAGLELTSVSFDLGFPDASGAIDANSVALVSAAWAANQSGSNPVDVWRLWVPLPDWPNGGTISFAGGSVAGGVGGTAEPLVLSAGKNAVFFTPMGDYVPVNLGMLAIDGGSGLEFFQTQAWKTFITMGSATGSGPMKLGDVSALDGIFTGAVNEANTGWGVLGSVSSQFVVPDGNGGWRILIGQFAVPRGKVFTAAVRLVGDGVDTYATVNSVVTTLP